MLPSAIRLVGVAVAVMLTLVGGLRVAYGITTEGPPPFTLLDGCDGPCWLGIQPGVTSEADAEHLAQRAGAQTQMFGPRNPYITVNFTDADRSGQVNTSADGVALRVSVQVHDRCPSAFVVRYGVPTHITFSAQEYKLYYPAHGLRLYWAPSRTLRLDRFAVDIAANDEVLFAGYNASDRIHWVELMPQLQRPCP